MFEQDPQLAKMGAFMWAIFLLVLFIVFLVLKLCAVIAWSWWWVFAPLWIPFVLGLILSALGVKPPTE